MKSGYRSIYTSLVVALVNWGWPTAQVHCKSVIETPCIATLYNDERLRRRDVYPPRQDLLHCPPTTTNTTTTTTTRCLTIAAGTACAEPDDQTPVQLGVSRMQFYHCRRCVQWTVRSHARAYSGDMLCLFVFYLTAHQHYLGHPCQEYRLVEVEHFVTCQKQFEIEK